MFFAVSEHFPACWLVRSSYSRFEMTGCLMECSVKTYPELYWFGNRFSTFSTEIHIPSRTVIPSAACNVFDDFPASMRFLSRNATFSALNACSTCNLAASCENALHLIHKPRIRQKKLKLVSGFAKLRTIALAIGFHSKMHALSLRCVAQVKRQLFCRAAGECNFLQNLQNIVF